MVEKKERVDVVEAPRRDAAAQAGSWAGLRITGGTATFNGAFQLAAGGVILKVQFGFGVTLGGVGGGGGIGAASTFASA